MTDITVHKIATKPGWVKPKTHAKLVEKVFEAFQKHFEKETWECFFCPMGQKWEANIHPLNKVCSNTFEDFVVTDKGYRTLAFKVKDNKQEVVLTLDLDNPTRPSVMEGVFKTQKVETPASLIVKTFALMIAEAASGYYIQSYEDRFWDMAKMEFSTIKENMGNETLPTWMDEGDSLLTGLASIELDDEEFELY